MNRKILFFIILIIALIVLGLILFFIVGGGDVSRTPIISRFFPESKEIEILAPPEEKEKRIIIKEGEEKKFLNQLSDKPVVGAVFASSTVKVRYVEKASGHLFEIDPNNQNRKRISNTTILNIFNVLWSETGDKALIQFIKDEVINNFAANFTGSSTQGTFLPKNLKSGAISPKGNEMAYIEEIGNKGVVFTSDFENKNKKQIFSAPLPDFNLFWQDAENLSLLTKPSAFSNSFFYSLNIKNKVFEKIQEGFGLNVLWSPNAKELFTVKNRDGILENKILSLKENKEYNLSIKTLPEKCVWSKLNKEIIYCAVPAALPSGNYPDDWHQGKISFKDIIFKINYLTGENNILDEQIRNLDFDAINLFLSPGEKYLFFINKKDSILWGVQIL